nr:unnamed protein product [Callosobruchus analis]
MYNVCPHVRKTRRRTTQSTGDKKLIPKYKGPYEITKVLDNDRYVVTDVENFQITQKPFEGICSPDNMKLWLHDSVF